MEGDQKNRDGTTYLYFLHVNFLDTVRLHSGWKLKKKKSFHFPYYCIPLEEETTQARVRVTMNKAYSGESYKLDRGVN